MKDLKECKDIAMKRLMLHFFDIMSFYKTIDEKNPDDPKYDEAVCKMKSYY